MQYLVYTTYTLFIQHSPADYNTGETINSLQFAARCKDVTNSVAGGPAAAAAQLQALRRELNKAKASTGATASAGTDNSTSNGGVVGVLPGPKKPATLGRPV
jgi:hypothetical protein